MILSYRSTTLCLLGVAWMCFCMSAGVVRGEADPEPRIVSMRVGFDGSYKLGCWTPVEVDLLGGTERFTGTLLITAPDGDGVPTMVATPSSRPVGVIPGGLVTARLYVRVGRIDSSLQATFVADGKVQAKRTFRVGPADEERYITGGLPASSRLILQIGPSLGIGELLQGAESMERLRFTRASQLSTAEELPTQWYGYEGVDTVVLATSQAELYRPLLQSTARVAALKEWVQRGGRVAIFCGSQAEELLADDGVLADFLPGKFDSLAPLRQSVPIETFSGSDQPLVRNRRLSLQVPKLKDVQGSILAYSGNEPTDLPLVIRSRLGLGEVVFVGLDFDRQPFRDWIGREPFLRRALDWPKSDKAEQTNYGYAGKQDMVALLRDALDGQFEGVTTVPFVFVGMLVVGYILLIGPGDYFLVSKIFKRNELTWITFPVIVIAVSAGAYLLANWLKGDQFRVNQVEIVDVDTSRGVARGTVWTHFFTPQVETFDLTIEPVFLDSQESPPAAELVSWLGIPGYTQGGMSTHGGNNLLGRGGYAFNDQLSAMNAVPVQLWSTKTIAADWMAEVKSPLEAQLRRDGEELLAGQIINDSTVLLEDSLLCYGPWAYYLGRIMPDAVMTIDESLQPRTVKTSLTGAGAGDVSSIPAAQDGTIPFEWARSDVSRLVKGMMFFKAINGEDYSGASNRYQQAIDLSHLLKHKDVAILFAKVSNAGSDWFDDDRALKSEEDRRWTYYRFILPVTDE